MKNTWADIWHILSQQLQYTKISDVCVISATWVHMNTDILIACHHSWYKLTALLESIYASIAELNDFENP